MNVQDIKLGQLEEYDTRKVKCWSFKKVNDVIDGVVVAYSNMAGGFPFEALGRTWKNSEEMYLCGEFTDRVAQEEIVSMKSGYASKRFGKAKFLNLVRKDFPKYRLEWMKFCVWSKAKGNKDFAERLLMSPDDAVLIENTTTDNGGSAQIWGCSNILLEKERKAFTEWIDETFKGSKKAKEEYLAVEINKIKGCGVFVGENNIGKILMLIRDALRNGYELDIDYDLLNRSNIVLFGEKVVFTKP